MPAIFTSREYEKQTNIGIIAYVLYKCYLVCALAGARDKMTSSDILCNPRTWSSGIASTVEEGMKDCLTVAEDLAEEHADLASELNDLKRSMVNMARVVHKIHHVGEAMVEVQRRSDPAQGQSSNSEAPDLQEVFRLKMGEAREEDVARSVSSHSKVKAIEALLSNPGVRAGSSRPQEETISGDLVMTQKEVSLVCPLTKKLMEDPVTSKKCHHSFSKSAILSHIRNYRQRRGHAKCPIGGCDQKVVEADLEPNADLEKAVRRKQREERLGKTKDKENVVQV